MAKQKDSYDINIDKQLLEKAPILMRENQKQLDNLNVVINDLRQANLKLQKQAARDTNFTEQLVQQEAELKNQMKLYNDIVAAQRVNEQKVHDAEMRIAKAEAEVARKLKRLSTSNKKIEVSEIDYLSTNSQAESNLQFLANQQFKKTSSSRTQSKKRTSYAPSTKEIENKVVLPRAVREGLKPTSNDSLAELERKLDQAREKIRSDYVAIMTRKGKQAQTRIESDPSKSKHEREQAINELKDKARADLANIDQDDLKFFDQKLLQADRGEVQALFTKIFSKKTASKRSKQIDALSNLITNYQLKYYEAKMRPNINNDQGNQTRYLAQKNSLTDLLTKKGVSDPNILDQLNKTHAARLAESKMSDIFEDIKGTAIDASRGVLGKRGYSSFVSDEGKIIPGVEKITKIGSDHLPYEEWVRKFSAHIYSDKLDTLSPAGLNILKEKGRFKNGINGASITGLEKAYDLLRQNNYETDADIISNAMQEAYENTQEASLRALFEERFLASNNYDPDKKIKTTLSKVADFTDRSALAGKMRGILPAHNYLKSSDSNFILNEGQLIDKPDYGPDAPKGSIRYAEIEAQDRLDTEANKAAAEDEIAKPLINAVFKALGDQLQSGDSTEQIRTLMAIVIDQYLDNIANRDAQSTLISKQHRGVDISLSTPLYDKDGQASGTLADIIGAEGRPDKEFINKWTGQTFGSLDLDQIVSLVAETVGRSSEKLDLTKWHEIIEYFKNSLAQNDNLSKTDKNVLYTDLEKYNRGRNSDLNSPEKLALRLESLLKFANNIDVSIKRRADLINEAAGNPITTEEAERELWLQAANSELQERYNRSHLARDTFEKAGGLNKVEQAITALGSIDDKQIQNIIKAYEAQSNWINEGDRAYQEKAITGMFLQARMGAKLKDNNPFAHKGQSFYSFEGITGLDSLDLPKEASNWSYADLTNLKYQAGYIANSYLTNNDKVSDVSIRLEGAKKEAERLLNILKEQSDEISQARAKVIEQDILLLDKALVPKDKAAAGSSFNPQERQKQLSELLGLPENSNIAFRPEGAVSTDATDQSKIDPNSLVGQQKQLAKKQKNSNKKKSSSRKNNKIFDTSLITDTDAELGAYGDITTNFIKESDALKQDNSSLSDHAKLLEEAIMLEKSKSQTSIQTAKAIDQETKALDNNNQAVEEHNKKKRNKKTAEAAKELPLYEFFDVSFDEYTHTYSDGYNSKILSATQIRDLLLGNYDEAAKKDSAVIKEALKNTADGQILTKESVGIESDQVWNNRVKGLAAASYGDVFHKAIEVMAKEGVTSFGQLSKEGQETYQSFYQKELNKLHKLGLDGSLLNNVDKDIEAFADLAEKNGMTLSQYAEVPMGLKFNVDGQEYKVGVKNDEIAIINGLGALFDNKTGIVHGYESLQLTLNLLAQIATRKYLNGLSDEELDSHAGWREKRNQLNAAKVDEDSKLYVNKVKDGYAQMIEFERLSDQVVADSVVRAFKIEEGKAAPLTQEERKIILGKQRATGIMTGGTPPTPPVPAGDIKEYLNILEKVNNYSADLERLKGKKNPTLDDKTEIAALEKALALEKQALTEAENGLDKNNPENARKIAEYEVKRAKAIKGQNKQYKEQSGIFGNLTQKMMNFFSYGLSNEISRAVMQTFRQMIAYIDELDKKLVNLQIATGATRYEARDMLRDYAQLADELGRTTTVVADAANDWLRAGYTGADAAELIKSSMYLSTLGQMDATKSTEALISVMKGWKLQVKDIIGVVDKMVAIDMSAAISSQELATAMAKANYSAQNAGVGMETFMGMVTTISETSQQAPEQVGTALRTIMARMGNVKAGKYSASYEDTLSSNYDSSDYESLNDIEVVLKTIGISMRNSATEFKNTEDILSEVASRWSSLDDITRNAIANAVAGTRQRESFLIMMENWGKVNAYAELATNAYGTATKKMESYLQSLDAAKAGLENAKQELANREGIATIKKGIYNLLADIVNGIKNPLITGIAALIPYLLTLKDSTGALRITFDQLAAKLTNGQYTAKGYVASAIAPTLGMAVGGLIGGKLGQASGREELATAGTILGGAVGKYALGGIAEGIASKAALSSLAGPIGAAIGLAVSTGIVLYKRQIQKSLEETAEAITKAASNYSDVLTSQSDIDRFFELSNGVNKLGKNLALTDDEYTEFLNLNAELASKFPDLITYTDAQGNKLIDLGRDAAAASKNYDALTNSIELAQKAADKAMVSNATVKDGLFGKITARENARNNYQDELEAYNLAVEHYNSLLNATEGFTVSGELERAAEAIEKSEIALRAAAEDLNDYVAPFLRINASSTYNQVKGISGGLEGWGAISSKYVGLSDDELIQKFQDYSAFISYFGEKGADQFVNPPAASASLGDIQTNRRNQAYELATYLARAGITNEEDRINFLNSVGFTSKNGMIVSQTDEINELQDLLGVRGASLSSDFINNLTYGNYQKTAKYIKSIWPEGGNAGNIESTISSLLLSDRGVPTNYAEASKYLENLTSNATTVQGRIKDQGSNFGNIIVEELFSDLPENMRNAIKDFQKNHPDATKITDEEFAGLTTTLDTSIANIESSKIKSGLTELFGAETLSNIEGEVNTIKELKAVIDALAGSYDKLKQAQDEAIGEGSIKTTTFLDLISTYGEGIANYFEVDKNGKITGKNSTNAADAIKSAQTDMASKAWEDEVKKYADKKAAAEATVRALTDTVNRTKDEAASQQANEKLEAAKADLDDISATYDILKAGQNNWNKELEDGRTNLEKISDLINNLNQDYQEIYAKTNGSDNNFFTVKDEALREQYKEYETRYNAAVASNRTKDAEQYKAEMEKIIVEQANNFNAYSDEVFNRVQDKINKLEMEKPEKWSSLSQIKTYYSDIAKYNQEIADEAAAFLAESDNLTDAQARSLVEKYNQAVKAVKQAELQALQDQKSYYDQVYNALTNTINDYIKDIEKQKEIVEDSYDTELDKLKDKQTSIERTNKLIELQNNLLDAQKQKEKVFIAGVGWSYRENRKKVKEATQAIAEFGVTDQITDLENAKQVELDKLNKRTEAWQEYLALLEEQLNQEQKSLDRKLLLDEFKLESEEELYKVLQTDMTSFNEYAEQHQSDLTKIYTDYTSSFETFFNDYSSVVSQIDLKSEELIATLKEVATYLSVLGDFDYEFLTGNGNGAGGNGALEQYKANIMQMHEDNKDNGGKVIATGNASGGGHGGLTTVWEEGGTSFHYQYADGTVSDSWTATSGQIAAHKGYANGIENGPVGYTGLAMLHGTPGHPEYVLNSDQAYNLLRYMSTTTPQFESASNSISGTQYILNGDVVLNQADNADQLFAQVTQAMSNKWNTSKMRRI